MLSIADDTAELTPVFNPSANWLFAFSITCSFIVSTSISNKFIIVSEFGLITTFVPPKLSAAFL